MNCNQTLVRASPSAPWQSSEQKQRHGASCEQNKENISALGSPWFRFINLKARNLLSFYESIGLEGACLGKLPSLHVSRECLSVNITDQLMKNCSDKKPRSPESQSNDLSTRPVNLIDCNVQYMFAESKSLFVNNYSMKKIQEFQLILFATHISFYPIIMSLGYFFSEEQLWVSN